MDGLDVVIADSSNRLSGYGTRHTPSRAPKRRLRRHLPFALLVLLPTLVTAVYLYGFASDQYVSEARFVVRGPTQQAPGALSSLLQTAGVSRAQDDTYAVQDYMLSRDALAELVKSADLKAVFSRPEADGLSRFPLTLPYLSRLGLPQPGGDSFEHLFKYYQKHVDVEMDSTTGVSELTVKSFRPEDSQRIASALLSAGEQLVNRMNDRERENTLRDARKEVQLSEQRVRDVSDRLAEFRNKQSLLDPNKQSVPMLQAITNLQAKLSSVKLELSQLQPNSPLLASTRQRAAALQAQIDAAKSEITGTDSSLVPKIREFDLLTLERDFADKQLASATTSLETARINADRQQLYLEAIVQPNAPDYAAYPRRFAILAMVFASFAGLYAGGALLIAGAREHKLV
jgi:capsular polysaccharide transport system permease protein